MSIYTDFHPPVPRRTADANDLSAHEAQCAQFRAAHEATWRSVETMIRGVCSWKPIDPDTSTGLKSLGGWAHGLIDLKDYFLPAHARTAIARLVRAQREAALLDVAKHIVDHPRIVKIDLHTELLEQGVYSDEWQDCFQRRLLQAAKQVTPSSATDLYLCEVRPTRSRPRSREDVSELLAPIVREVVEIVEHRLDQERAELYRDAPSGRPIPDYYALILEMDDRGLL